jgi:hypothetical protein
VGKFLSGIFSWFGGKLAALVLILAVLLAGAWVGEESKKILQQQTLRAVLSEQRTSLRQQIAELERTAAERKRQAKDAVETIRGLLAKHVSQLERARAERQAVWDEHPIARNIPMTDAWTKIRLLDAEIAAYEQAVEQVARLNAARQKALDTVGEEVERRRAELAAISAQITGIDATLSQGTFSRLIVLVREKLPIALGILLGIILVPIVIKVFFYFVVAPWVMRRPPIRLLAPPNGRITPIAGGPADSQGRMSAVSQSVLLGEHQVLLVQPDYLQSTSVLARKKTQWLLNPTIPFSSLLSGMYLLTRVGASGAEPVVISATKDPLIEVGIVELSEGAAFVCQPRSLAGVIQDERGPIRITRHWRVGSLHAWLTLQLRFLVFHGPGQLILKGCRGIRIERAGTGRLINQAATLGFSADLDYANTRCETFVSYWTGKEELFNDLFTGEGVYVYEEMPDLKRTSGITGRGMEGFTDALLKAFGV